MVRIAHFGDTHIKNLKYHYEYRKAFEHIYETLRRENVDYIVHCGDWLTQKHNSHQSILS